MDFSTDISFLHDEVLVSAEFFKQFILLNLVALELEETLFTVEHHVLKLTWASLALLHWKKQALV